MYWSRWTATACSSQPYDPKPPAWPGVFFVCNITTAIGGACLGNTHMVARGFALNSFTAQFEDAASALGLVLDVPAAPRPRDSLDAAGDDGRVAVMPSIERHDFIITFAQMAERECPKLLAEPGSLTQVELRAAVSRLRLAAQESLGVLAGCRNDPDQLDAVQRWLDEAFPDLRSALAAAHRAALASVA